MGEEISKENAEIIFKEHSNFIYQVALFLTKSKELSDDITQETFLQVFRKYHTFDSTKPIRPWMYKITLNTTRNILRKQKWLKFIGELPESSCLDLVENAILKNEEEKELLREINNLDLKSKEVVIMHFYSGMKLKEVSDSLGIPLGTCKSRLNSALNALRKRLPKNELNFGGKVGTFVKQTNSDIGNLLENALQQNSPSLSFESVWSKHLKKRGILKKTTAAPLIICITLILLSIVGFTGYKISRNIDKTDYPFVDDPRVIGKWESVDSVKKVDDFIPERKYCKDNLFLTALIFKKDGEMLSSFENYNLAPTTFSWTKDKLLNKQEKTASSYEIKEINGFTYMFFEWKSGDYIFRNMRPQYYVLKKVDSQDYSNFQVARINEDKIDYPFVDDTQMKGKWESVDFVKTIDSYKPGTKGCLEDLYVTGLNLDENGKLTITRTSGELSSPSVTWTKSLIINRENKTASNCVIKGMNGTTYMFYEWKSGDYVYRGMKPSYYVLKKVE